jgi:hypothetical protein
MQPDKKPNAKIATVVVIVVVAAIATGVLFMNRKDTDATNTATNSTNSSQTATPVPTETTGADDAVAVAPGTFKNGSYTATGSYRTPEDTETITVQLSVTDDIVTDVSVAYEPKSRESTEYQTEFANNYKSEVVGKKLSDIELNRIAGSSLTPKGFNDALEKIRTDAKM